MNVLIAVDGPVSPAPQRLFVHTHVPVYLEVDGRSCQICVTKPTQWQHSKYATPSGTVMHFHTISVFINNLICTLKLFNVFIWSITCLIYWFSASPPMFSTDKTETNDGGVCFSNVI